MDKGITQISGSLTDPLFNVLFVLTIQYNISEGTCLFEQQKSNDRRHNQLISSNDINPRSEKGSVGLALLGFAENSVKVAWPTGLRCRHWHGCNR